MSSSVLEFTSEKVGITIQVPSGSINDLASIPWFFRRVFAVNGPNRQAAALHDYLYETKGLEGLLTRKECDVIFLEAMLVEKRDFWEAYPQQVKSDLEAADMKSAFMSEDTLVSLWQAQLMYHGVRIGGGSHF